MNLINSGEEGVWAPVLSYLPLLWELTTNIRLSETCGQCYKTHKHCTGLEGLPGDKCYSLLWNVLNCEKFYDIGLIFGAYP